MNKCKRFLALFLVLCMTLSVVPFSAFAAEATDESDEQVELQTGDPGSETVTDSSVDPVEGSPDEGTSNEVPSDGASNEDPSDGDSNEDPSAGASNEDPSAGASNEDSSAGAANEVPSDGVATEVPSDGASDEIPSDADGITDWSFGNRDSDEVIEGEAIASWTVDATRTARATSSDAFYKIVHLDCGRKYFSPENIKKIIDNAAAAGFNQVELYLSDNQGFRFALDDKNVTTSTGNTYDLTPALGDGYSDGSKYPDGSGKYLTQSEMSGIISYAAGKGIDIVPCINVPGHMGAILEEFTQFKYSGSNSSIDLENDEAVAFALAITEKYATYFESQGVKFYNLGADEYANDLSTMGFQGLYTSGKYQKFVDFLNSAAQIVINHGMTPRAFNDGIYYNEDNTHSINSDIQICYWSCGWSGYNLASAQYLVSQGMDVINTHGDYYWVLGNPSWQCTADKASQFNYTSFQYRTGTTGNGTISDPAGAMFCIWCDVGNANGADDGAAVVSATADVIAAFGAALPASETDPEPTPDPDPDPEPGESVEVTENETITVTVGQTATATIEGADYSNNTVETELDKSIATVSAEYKQVTGGTEEVKATSITSGSSYYIKNSDGQYLNASPEWVSDISSAALWTATSSGSGYTLKNGNKYLRYVYPSLDTNTRSARATTWTFDNGTFSYSGIITDYTLGDAYTVTTKDPVDATTVTFTGVAVGTTYVTVGNTRYTINVVAEDLSTVTPLTVEYWITNMQVTADGATSKTISAESVYGEAGVDISTLVPANGTYTYGSVVYWKGTVLDSSNKQTTASGAENDKTGSGKDFNLIRYYNGSWQYFYEADGTWNTISSTDQVVIYWLQPTEVTKEITTLVKDWGYAPDTQGDNESKVALTVAVVYPDGTVSPAEGDMYSTSTTLFNYWADRDIGLVAPVNNSDYQIAKITVTDGTRDKSGTGKWGSNDTITWEKVTNEADQQWYDETTYWDETVGGTPMVNGATSNIIWPSYNTAKLVLIYLKPVHYDTNLTVNWVDDSAAGALISTMEVAVSSDGTPITFYNGLKQTSALPTEGVGGTFTLDDDAYVTNSSNVNQTFNKNISTVPGVADVYKTGLYQYVSADLSADGMTLTLHYNINSSKLSKQYVVDFGLPVNVPLSDLIENSGSVTKVEITGGDAIVNDDKSITYQPATMMTGIATVSVKLTFSDSSTTQTVRIAFVPATTVYYEEGFATYNGWIGGNKGTVAQTTQIAGQSSDKYGYDDAYVTNVTVGPSNGTQATTSTKGATADFSFTGTGVDIYANCATDTGWLMIQVKNEAGGTVAMQTVKLLRVNTALLNGTTDATKPQEVFGYNVPVACISGLTHGTYSVTITNISENGVVANLDGFRIYGTLATEPDFYTTDKEDNPTFIELRDQVLAGLSVTSNGSGQVNAALPVDTTVAVVASSDKYTQANIDDLLKNGPKNEIYLQPNQALVLEITTAREVQIGLKALNAETTYTINTINNGEGNPISTSTDMFYTVLGGGTSGEQTITINNTGNGILSVTKLKVCDDPNAALVPLTWDDLANALDALGISGDPNGSKPTEPTEPIDPKPTDPEPTEPEVTYADAALTVSLVDYTGKQVASAELTANGVVGETETFTAEEVLAAAKAQMPKGYVLVDESKVTGAEVVYGESGTVTVQIGKTAALKAIYVNLRGKNVGTAAITKVQTSSGNCKFSASEIRANAPANRRAVWLTSVRVPYGSEMTIVVPVF